MKRSDLDTAEMLRLIDEMRAGPLGEDTRDVPARLPGVPYKVVLAKLEQLGAQRLIDWGVVITRPWLTGYGMARLRQAADFAVRG